MDAKTLLLKREKAYITSLFKGFLTILEELKDEHDEKYRALQDSLPSEYLPLLICANPFTEDKLFRLRKRILDIGNESIRASEQDAENYLVTFVFKN